MNRLITIGRVLAILTIIIGIVHEAMTFHHVITEGFQGLDAVWQRTFTYFSLGCGGLLLICGLLLLMLLRRVGRHAFLTNPLVAIAVFATVNGVLAVWFMPGNPFAWVVSVLGIGLFLTATGIRSKHRRQ